MACISATPAHSRSGDEGPFVVVTIGPVNTASAHAWIRDAEEFLALVDRDPSLKAPEIVTSVVRRLVGEWRAAATEPEFLWTSEVPVRQLRALASHWAGVASKVRHEQSAPTRRPSDEAREFYDAMVAGVVVALAHVDNDGFAGAFAGVMPDFGASVSGPVAPAMQVLVVDDTDDIRLLLKIALEADGRFKVVGEARDGLEAIDRAAALRPDVILLDLAMPRMDGLTALPALLSACPRTRIVIFSANQAARSAALTAGAHAFVSKSAAREVLVAALLGD
jgi:CheY-like chemotaxis protein